MKKLLLIALLMGFTHLIFAQDKPAYIIYNAQGKKVSYGKMIKSIAQNDVLLFGEIHNNPIAHWLEYEVTVDLSQKKSLILGAEMMEADNQDALNKYLKKEIDADEFANEARLWPNYPTDYAPLIDFAKDKNIPFVATNIPRRYASLVFKGDFSALDTLSAKEKSWIAPLPIAFDPDLPDYKNILTMMGEHGSLLLVKAQAIKDATMAYFILKNFRAGSEFVHFNGAYHSDDHEGIVWYLKKGNDQLKYVTISTVSQENIHKLDKENLGKADFIICVDGNMTNTY